MKKSTRLFYLLSFVFITTSAIQSQEFDGYALFNSLNSNTVFLIDKNGDIAHTWSLDRPCNYTVLLMDSGNIMRGAVRAGNAINGPAVGGMVQEIDPQGNVVWGFEYSGSDHVAHHDICLMPEGNVLLTAWEAKNATELDEMGYTGTANNRYATHFVEVSQNGTDGEIVWEWHIWDHFIQDVDPDKPNYGVVSEHPELMNINVQTSGGGGPGGGGPGGGNGGDWFHVNGVDYNAELDQIAFSSRYLSEIFIIDHSTTTEEAAGHTGGNAGKGGDFLYRWGKPANYDMVGNQTIAGPVHDSRWIPDDGRPRGGYLQFFNNEGVGGSSTTDALELPFAADGYNYEREAGQAFGPMEATWRHICLDNADGQSAANSLPNGNTFVNLSREYMYEVDQDNNIVWQYAEGPAKAFRYTCDHPGIQALIAQGVIEDLCMLSAVDEIATEKVSISPNPSTGLFSINGLNIEDKLEKIEVFDFSGKIIKQLKTEFEVDLTEYVTGIYFIKLSLGNGNWVMKKVVKQ